METDRPIPLDQHPLAEQIKAEAHLLFEIKKAEELQRQKQQGLGRPIISVEVKGYRVVSVWDRIYTGKWKTFTEFLLEYLRTVLGAEWGKAELAKTLDERHAVLQWYDRICRLQAAHYQGPGKMYSTPNTGAQLAYLRLAYNLYLIAHNNKDIQTRLIDRLKRKDGFQGAFYETQVAAWLIRAGFELEFEDESDRTSTHCEFTATYTSTGDKYSVEAKSQEMESANPSRPKIGRKLNDALQKKANHKRLIFLNLNQPIHTPESADAAANFAERVVRRSAGMKVGNVPAPQAYVCITNMVDQYALDGGVLATMVSFVGFRIADFMTQYASVLEAVRARERHWPMHQLFESLREHREIPQTFDGELPSQVFTVNPLPRLHIGHVYSVPEADGQPMTGRLTHAVVVGDKAQCALFDESRNQSFMASFALSPAELADYDKCPDTFFGVYQQPTLRIETAIELFDFFFSSYRNTPKERLLELLGDPDGALAARTQKDLAEMLCERMVNNAVAQGFLVQPSGKVL